MSYYPPPDGQSPYYGYPPPPIPSAGPGFAYVPAPVMMPYPPQHEVSYPSFINNHYYPPPPQPEIIPDPVIVVDNTPPELIDWAPVTTATAPSLMSRAYVAGREGWDRSPLWAIRAHHSGNLVPGKLAIKHRAAYIPFAGKEVPVHNFEVLCAPAQALHWLASSNGQVPHNAVIAGNTQAAEPLYIGRTKHRGSFTPGKIHPSHGCCYISFDGSEIPYKYYEVLCRV